MSLVQSCAPIPSSPPFPTRRSSDLSSAGRSRAALRHCHRRGRPDLLRRLGSQGRRSGGGGRPLVAPRLRARQLRRSEEHTSELQSRGQLVCRLLLEKKKNNSHI